MNIIDGAEPASRNVTATYDVVVVGSGPAGSIVARNLARAGAKVAVVEEGRLWQPEEFPRDGFSAMTSLYRGMGATLISGNSPMPFVQGRAVGGTSVINGAICWRLPRNVYDEWIAADPALAEALPWEEIEKELDVIQRDLNIAPTDPAVAGRKNELMAKGAEALGLEHRPISRNVSGCRGLGRCLQGCPEGHKMSVDRSILPDACAHGAVIYSSTTVEELDLNKNRCIGVRVSRLAGGRIRLTATKAVVLAASAIQTPLLIDDGLSVPTPVASNFQCHPGVSITARFKEPVRAWEGATQGHETTGLRREGIKFEVLGYDLSLMAARRKGVGRALARDIDELAHWVDWGAAIRATATGTVEIGPKVKFSLNVEDMKRVRKGVSVMGQMMLAAGAEFVAPGVFGWDDKVANPDRMAAFELEGPLDPKAYSMAVTHMFGTCRMGSDPARSVVRPDFRLHDVEGLYVADSSVFPTNTSVNPQTSIMALAALCARRVIAS